jgi:hypothetical protein
MVKIQTTERDAQLVLLGGRQQRPGASISVDQKNVISINPASRQLVRSMCGRGVTFLPDGLAMQHALEQIMEQPECLR